MSLQEKFLEKVDSLSHELVEPSPTIIKGGTKENIIPELCEATCDIRITPGMTSEGTLQEVRAVIDSLKREDPSIDAEVSSTS